MLRPGTLELFVLRALRDSAKHGYAVIAWLREASGGELNIEEGALYHALHRMTAKGLLAAEWAPSETNRNARYYRLTPLGRRELLAEANRWSRYAALVARVLRHRKDPA